MSRVKVKPLESWKGREDLIDYDGNIMPINVFLALAAKRGDMFTTIFPGQPTEENLLFLAFQMETEETAPLWMGTQVLSENHFAGNVLMMPKDMGLHFLKWTDGHGHDKAMDLVNKAMNPNQQLH